MTRLLRAAALFFSFAFAASALAQTTVILQQGPTYAGSTDAWIICCGGADMMRGGDNEFEIRNEASDSALVRFKIFAAEGGPVPDGATINWATLSLYKYG